MKCKRNLLKAKQKVKKLRSGGKKKEDKKDQEQKDEKEP
jgi:exonuclease VII small subunit